MSTKLVWAIAALALPGAVQAAGPGITYDCDTAANHYSELQLPAPNGPFTASGSVRLNSLAASSEYTPIIRIQVADATAPGESPRSYAGFSLVALPADAKKTPSGSPAVQMLSYNLTGKDDEVLPLSLLAKPGTIQAFTLSYDGKNVVVNLGKEVKSLPLTAPHPVVRVVCSTGEFLLTDFVIQPTS